jgi:hypothetical protein
MANQPGSPLKEHRRLIILFGDSLLMDAVEASLADRPEIDLVRVRTAIIEFEKRVNSLSPDLVIFDFDTIHSQFVIPLLRARPDVPLVGLDFNSNQVVVLSGRAYTTRTAQELAKLIQSQTTGPAQPISTAA